MYTTKMNSSNTTFFKETRVHTFKCGFCFDKGTRLVEDVSFDVETWSVDLVFIEITSFNFDPTSIIFEPFVTPTSAKVWSSLAKPKT